MRTDKQFFSIFRACPELVYELAGLPSPGPCQLRSESFKEFARTADAVLEPHDKKQPACVIEVQFQRDETIYTRLVIEMALAQEKKRYRGVQGIIFFARKALDPRTPPWQRVVQAVYLDEALEKLRLEQPEHLALDVLAPICIESDSALEAAAASHYHRIRQQSLPLPQRDALLAVFESWLFERFKTMDRKKLAMILKFPTADITSTVAGRQILEEGMSRGIEQGIEKGIEQGRDAASLEAIRKMGGRHFGKLAKTLDARLKKLPTKHKERLFEAMMDMGSWKDVAAWVAKKSAKC
jgi:predicted transposase YdaD